MKTIILDKEESDLVVDALRIYAELDCCTEHNLSEQVNKLANQIELTSETHRYHPRKWSKLTGFRNWVNQGKK